MQQIMAYKADVTVTWLDSLRLLYGDVKKKSYKHSSASLLWTGNPCTNVAGANCNQGSKYKG